MIMGHVCHESALALLQLVFVPGPRLKPKEPLYLGLHWSSQNREKRIWKKQKMAHKAPT
jgi:hypothetical protein